MGSGMNVFKYFTSSENSKTVATNIPGIITEFHVD